MRMNVTTHNSGYVFEGTDLSDGLAFRNGGFLGFLTTAPVVEPVTGTYHVDRDEPRLVCRFEYREPGTGEVRFVRTSLVQRVSVTAR